MEVAPNSYLPRALVQWQHSHPVYTFFLIPILGKAMRLVELSYECMNYKCIFLQN